MSCLITSTDNALEFIKEAINELQVSWRSDPDKFDGFSDELQQKAKELSEELKAIHGALEDLYTLAKREN